MRPALMVLVDDPPDGPVEGVPGLSDQTDTRALLASVLGLARQVPRVGRVLLFHPAEAEARLASRSLGFRLWPQLGATPGERYTNAFRQAPELGYDGAVVIGLDLSSVTVDVVSEAADLLAEHPGAIVRDSSGGIAVLALQEPQPTIFSGPARPRYDEIVTRARQQRVRLVELTPPGGPERPIRAGDTGPERPIRAGDTGPERPIRAGDTGLDHDGLAASPAAQQ